MSNRVSVVIPAYKAERTICRAVDSVLAQTVPVYEIIVVDDGSPDGQNEVIERTYGDQVILIRQANGKTASARNAGIERATGDFIAFLDADDYWAPEKLATQLGIFERHPEVAVVAGRFHEQGPDGTIYDSSFHNRTSLAWNTVLRPRGAKAFRLASGMWTGTVVIRCQAIGENRFITGLEPAEDRDFWVRIVKDHPAYLCSQPLATYVQEPGSISRSGIERDCNSMLMVVNRHRRLLGHTATREWKSYVYFRWAANERRPLKALVQLIRSIILWPAAYRECRGSRHFGRTKRFVLLAGEFLGLRSGPESV
jgi:glycosyltransferase involved in cell wall biosynthesis